MTIDQGVRTVALSPRSHEVMLKVLDAFDISESCLPSHGHTAEVADEVMALARGPWAPYTGRWNSHSDAVGLDLTAYQVEVLHCVVSSVEPWGPSVDADPQEIIDMESSIGNIKMIDGYQPTYNRRQPRKLSLAERLMEDESVVFTAEEEAHAQLDLDQLLRDLENES